MTRDEFIKALGDALETEKLPNVVDVYVRAGMLKLDEPKSAEEKFFDKWCGLELLTMDRAQVRAMLAAAGVKIVEK